MIHKIFLFFLFFSQRWLLLHAIDSIVTSETTQLHEVSIVASNTESKRSLTGFYDHSLPIPYSIHDLTSQSIYDTAIHRKNRKLISTALESELTPLYPGYGTHFSYIYVGTPPQRQSVIIDTGSRLTAFPCTGCQQCGKHTNNYFDWKNSSTSVISDCKGKPCTLSQSYSEGSSWKAFRLTDKVYVGGLTIDMMLRAEKYRVDFTFGCQTYETGLFRTQLADGIMGLSMAEDTLPYVLHSKGITSTKIFALCYRVGGGIMTIGGVDQKIHGKSEIYYVRLLKKSGWYTVHLLDIQLQEQKEGSIAVSIGGDKDQWARGKGCIIDSGTTDTYLPSSLAARFKKIFKDMTNMEYTNNNIRLNQDVLEKLPNVIYTFEGTDGKPVQVTMRWTSYIDNVGNGKYAFRIYLTEGQGVVLGANFMNNHNIVFDPDGERVGFARSSCRYEHYGENRTAIRHKINS